MSASSSKRFGVFLLFAQLPIQTQMERSSQKLWTASTASSALLVVISPSLLGALRGLGSGRSCESHVVPIPPGGECSEQPVCVWLSTC